MNTRGRTFGPEPSAEGGRPRALLIHRYLAPDIPVYGWMLPLIAEAAQSAGFEVDLLSVQPSYAPGAYAERQPSLELRNGIRIRRISIPLWQIGDVGKSIAGTVFAAAAFLRALVGRYDVVMAATTPPVLVARAASLASRIRGSRFIYHCQDIHPEISQGLGVFASGWMTRLFAWLDRQTCHNAYRIVTLSGDMKRTLLERRGVSAQKVQIINNFSLQSEERDGALRKAAQLLPSDPARFRIVFSGNLGRFQGLEDLLTAASDARIQRPTDLVFVGGGVAEAGLRRQANAINTNVIFLGRQRKAVADAIVSQADLAVVSLRPGLIRFAYPSKTLDYLSAGVPILAILERDSELGQMILQHGLGVLAPPGDPDAITDAIEKSQALAAEAELRGRIREYARAEFGIEPTLTKWKFFFSSLIG